MRGWRLGWQFLFVAFAFAPAFYAAPPEAIAGTTVDQLDQLVSRVCRQDDGAAARQLAGVTLSERASTEKLAKWASELHGAHAREAIMAVTDAAAHFDPPAGEIPAMSPPDAETQQQILARTVEYVKKSLSKLPDFMARRQTTSFEVTTESRLTAQFMWSGGLAVKRKQYLDFYALGPAKSIGTNDARLFWIGTLDQAVTFRDGAEVQGASPAGKGSSNTMPLRMTTRGEFGTILNVVLVDVPQDNFVWGHWEQGAQGPLAVFRYSVPRDQSHFAVQWNANELPEYPAYHGVIAVDPATGSIFRITVQTSGREEGFLYQSSILVEYAPTSIGGVNYICPARGVAMIKFFDAMADLDTQPPPISFRISINDVSFTGYQIFRSESRILP